MLGVQINTMLDFRDHLKHVTTNVQLIAKVLTKRKLSPNRKTLVIDQLLKSKYHATHLGIFRDKQLATIDRILNKVARNAIRRTPSLPTVAINRPTKEMGLGCAPLKDRATQLGMEHITVVLNKPMETRHIAFEHVTRVATVVQHCPKEAYEANQTKLHVLRIL
jgi:hypothetical protein